MGMAICVKLLLLLAVTAFSNAEELSSKDCENLGFTGLALCSDCKSFAEYVKDQELVSDCLKCCVEDSDDSMSKVAYAGALLEVCMRKLVFYPEIVGFIEEEKDKFPSVKVQYSFNSPPKLIMLDDIGEHAETISAWRESYVHIDSLKPCMRGTTLELTTGNVSTYYNFFEESSNLHQAESFYTIPEEASCVRFHARNKELFVAEQPCS